MITSIELTDAEWHSLRELRKGPLKKRIPLSHQLRLIHLGLARYLFAGIIATDEGRRYRHGRDAGTGAAVRPPVLRLVMTVAKRRLFLVDREV